MNSATGRTRLWVPLAAMFLLGLVGCGHGSDRSLSIGDRQLITLAPIQICRSDPDGNTVMPVAVSRDGRRIALVVDKGHTSSETTTVIDIDSLKPLGSLTQRGSSGNAPSFSRDGSQLYLGIGNDFYKWDYTTGAKTKLAAWPVSIQETSALMDDVGWNLDRTIGIQYPQLERWVPANTKPRMQSGHVKVCPTTDFTVPINETAGFDEFGNAWFGRGNLWTSVDPAGRSAKLPAHPKLVHDQTKDRGSMHLIKTDAQVGFRGAKAYTNCIWLTDDRTTPRRIGPRVNQPDTRAALVFAGADVVEYGFLPGRKIAYVVCADASYLVPLRLEPPQPQAPAAQNKPQLSKRR